MLVTSKNKGDICFLISILEKLPEVKLEMIKLEAIEAMEVDVGELEKGTSMTGGVKSMFFFS